MGGHSHLAAAVGHCDESRIAESPRRRGALFPTLAEARGAIEPTPAFRRLRDGGHAWVALHLIVMRAALRGSAIPGTHARTQARP